MRETDHGTPAVRGLFHQEETTVKPGPGPRVIPKVPLASLASTRSNGWKLELKRFNTSQCGNFFTYKIAPIWNRLPAEAVNSASVEQFKIELDKVIDSLI